MSQEITQEYISVSGAAKRFGCSTTAVRQWIADGRVEAIRLGPKTIRILISSLDDLITEVLDSPTPNLAKHIPNRARRLAQSHGLVLTLDIGVFGLHICDLHGADCRARKVTDVDAQHGEHHELVFASQDIERVIAYLDNPFGPEQAA
ncbi:helix-turn-helix transcriptional regulator [Rhodococcus triatomae]|nr:hypothetical protein G419_25217 [Rhodococcus triatomae BKS 15-14]